MCRQGCRYVGMRVVRQENQAGEPPGTVRQRGKPSRHESGTTGKAGGRTARRCEAARKNRKVLFLLDEVEHAGGGAMLLQAGDVLQVATEDGDAVGIQAAAGMAAQAVVDGGGRHPLAIVLISGHLKVLMEILHGDGHDLEVTVMLHDGLHLVGREPPLLTVFQDDGAGLPIEGLVVGLVCPIDRSRNIIYG